MRVPKKQRGVIEVGINPRRLTYCAGRPSVLLGPSWLAFVALYQLRFPTCCSTCEALSCSTSAALPFLRDLRTSKTCMMSAAKDSDKVRKKAAFYNYFSSTTTKMSKRNVHDKQEDWLVEFITLCTGGETASQMKGIDQLREVAWELLRKGRAGELEKESFEDIRDADEADDNQNEDEEESEEEQDDDEDEEEEDGGKMEGEGESEFFLRLNPVGVKRMASLHKVSSSVHTFSTVKLTKGVEGLNKAEIELAFLEELAGVGDFKTFSALTGIKIGTGESIDLADVTVMKIGGVKGNLKVLDETRSSEEVLAMFCPYDKSSEEFGVGNAEENDSRALCANIYGVIGIKKLVVPCGPPTIKMSLIIQNAALRKKCESVCERESTITCIWEEISECLLLLQSEPVSSQHGAD